MTIKRTIITVILLLSAQKIEAVKKTRLTWVNGIAHNLDHMEEGGVSISDYFGGKKVEFCHNPTSMTSDDDYVGFIGDLTQAGTHKLGRITSEVDTLVRFLKDAIAQVGDEGLIVHIAHSQGVLITSLAAKRLSPSEMSRIELICIGGATSIRKCDYPHFRRIINYWSTNDPLLFIVPSAVQALQTGFLHSTNGEPEFVFLSPRGGDPVLDHMLLGPTYSQVLQWEGLRYQMSYQSMHERFLRNLLGNSLYMELQHVMRHVIVLVMSFFIHIYLSTYDGWKRVEGFLVDDVFVPMFAFLFALFSYVKENLQLWKNSGEKFEPLSIQENLNNT